MGPVAGDKSSVSRRGLCLPFSGEKHLSMWLCLSSPGEVCRGTLMLGAPLGLEKGWALSEVRAALTDVSSEAAAGDGTSWVQITSSGAAAIWQDS